MFGVRPSQSIGGPNEIIDEISLSDVESDQKSAINTSAPAKNTELPTPAQQDTTDTEKLRNMDQDEEIQPADDCNGQNTGAQFQNGEDLCE